MTLFTKRKKQSDALKVRLLDRPHTHLRADEFKADKELVHLAAVVLENSNMQLLLQVMRNEHPGFEVLPFGTNANDRLLAQGRSEGYSIALATLESLGVQANIPERLVSTFGSEEKESQTG